MIDTNELNACLARKGLSKVDGAKIVKVSPKTFYYWMSKGVIPTDKAELLIVASSIEKPEKNFFNGVLSIT